MNRKTVHRCFFVWDFEKEELWLNEMALQGWALDSVSLCTYNFVACQPGEYGIRLEMRCSDTQYIDFMAETGAEYIGRVFQWIYFRKPSEAGAFDIFSDIDSKIAHLNRIGNMLLAIGALNLICGLNIRSDVSWINLLCCAVLMYALGRIHGKKEALERERSWRE